MAFEHTFVSKNGMKTKKLTAMSAVREKCLECCAWSYHEVRLCPAKDCVLHPIRFGKYPKKTVAGSRFLKKK